MKDIEYENVIEFVNVGGGFMPANENCEELLYRTKKGEIISTLEVTKRDISFHRCYMSLLGFIYDYLPKKFHEAVEKKNFYKWLKHLKGQYKVVFTFADGSKMIEYDSISFGKMSNIQFKEYILEQMPYIYENIIGVFFKDELYDNIIATIEQEYERFFDKLI